MNTVWSGSVVVSASDCNREVTGSIPGRGASRSTLGKLFTHVCLCSPSSKLVPVQAGS